MFEEGGGLLNVVRSAALLREYQPRASLYPSQLDMTDCVSGRFWPWCTQPVFATAMPGAEMPTEHHNRETRIEKAHRETHREIRPSFPPTAFPRISSAFPRPFPLPGPRGGAV